MPYTPDPEAPGLSVDASGCVLRLRLERPDQRNALTRPMMDRLIHHVEGAVDRPELRAILLAGLGADFCAGADLRVANAPQPTRPRVGDIQRRLPRQAHRLVLALLEVQLPVVAMVRGVASGLGAHLAFAADLIVASETVRFVEPFVAHGFTPDSGGSFLLPRLVGLARARQVLLLGREIDAGRASRWELVHEVVRDDQLELRTEALLEDLASRATLALGLAKWLMNRAFDVPATEALAHEAQALELSSRSADFKEGLAAFAEKRVPRYRGR